MCEKICFPDSLTLTPGWEYNLNSIKKIEVTDDFMNLADSTKKCRAESIDNCTTRTYVDRVIKECECLPLNMRTNEFEEVNYEE